ncbi:hypothetical protein UYSO10_4970 [Kosakonia radicincitans]|uniref:hypothetical protein n=1 Tax=Kosakonia radicincitans TaxID=283686 RepID=UPI0011832FFA|nr:hypothetical protein [Kosakonia radicincitans]VVT53954.1 hypothetical protein UYSO10_4970 [Kosakonia radicincitans]
MLIPYENGLVIGMETTFNDLKAKHLKLVESQWKLREKLHSRARDLLTEYTRSLSLPLSGTWLDSQGKERPYVEIGVWKEPGKFTAESFPRLPMDEEYKLNFVVATTLDDTQITGGYRHGISLSLWYEGPVLYTAVGSGDDVAIFMVSPNEGGFYEVCAAIKLLISIAIDRSMPSAIII